MACIRRASAESVSPFLIALSTARQLMVGGTLAWTLDAVRDFYITRSKRVASNVIFRNWHMDS